MKRRITVLTALRYCSFCLCFVRRRAADRENPPHRFPGFKHCFQ